MGAQALVESKPLCSAAARDLQNRGTQAFGSLSLVFPHELAHARGGWGSQVLG